MERDGSQILSQAMVRQVRRSNTFVSVVKRLLLLKEEEIIITFVISVICRIRER